jgi:hypothetical protein
MEDFDFAGIAPDKDGHEPVVVPTEDADLTGQVQRGRPKGGGLTYNKKKNGRKRAESSGSKPGTVYKKDDSPLLDEVPVVTTLPDDEVLSYMPEACLKLSGRQRQVCRLKILGLFNTQIAAQVGYSLTTVTAIVNSNEGRLYREYLSNNLDGTLEVVAERIQFKALKAIARLADIIDDDDLYGTSLQAKCAFDILDRAGFKPPDRVQVSVNNNDITAEDLVALAEAKKVSEALHGTDKEG